MKKVLRYMALYLLLAILPFGIFAAVAECANNNYHNVFHAALVDKYHRLTETKGQKIIFVGGSSLPFGLRCDLIEQELGYKAVDFGMYASLGTGVMMELSLDGIKREDVVVLAPELNAQTYSEYFNADVLWESLNEERSMICALSWDEKKSMAYNYFDFLWNKWCARNAEGIADGELYARTSINEYGDLAYPRDRNIMPGGFDKSQPVTLSDLYDEAFFADMAAYVKAVRARGAEVYFTFSPINAAAVRFTPEEAAAFERYAGEKLGCTVLGSIEEATYDSGYFYDTNFHLNDTGAIMHTVRLIDLLKEQLSVHTPTTIEIPPLPQDSDDPETTDNPQETDVLQEFMFEVSDIGGMLYLTAIKDEYKGETAIRLPEFYNDRPIVGLKRGFLAGCEQLTVLEIPACYVIFDTGIFSGCPALVNVFLGLEEPAKSFVPADGLMDGAAAAVKLHIPAAKINKFRSNYTWNNYKKFFVAD